MAIFNSCHMRQFLTQCVKKPTTFYTFLKAAQKPATAKVVLKIVQCAMLHCCNKSHR